MRIIDEKGRLFGKLSLIDLFILIAVIGLGLGFVYKRTSEELGQIVNAGENFHVTFAANQLREFSVNAIDVGDLMFEQHDRQSLGRVVALEIVPATEYLLRTDGTAVLAEMEDRYKALITVECVGSITDRGFYVNGSKHIAEGVELVLMSNRVLLPDSLVQEIK